MASPQERIIEAALTLISERGPSDVTMAQIATTAGVARQTLYNHYADIPAIVADAVAHHNSEAVAHLEQAMSVVSDPSDAIRHVVRHVVAISAHGGHGPDMLNALPTSARQALTAFDDAVAEHLRGALVAGREDGSFRDDIDVDADAVILRSAIAGVVSLVVADPDDAPRIVDDAIRTLLAAVVTP